ncbi:MAG: leucine-rich repeat protein [Clostridia bacterium]|nr:leucine-rich repeat protein [Clostridia bacterium]
MQLSEKIVFLRKHKGMSQEQLANELDVSRQAVYKWETGITTPEIEKLKKISEIFDVSFDDLLNDKIDITNTPVVSTNTDEAQPEPDMPAPNPTKRTRLPIILIASISAVLAVVAIVIGVVLGSKHQHNFDKYAVYIAPTCTSAGIERRTCKDCGYEETRSIATVAHSPITVSGKAPTCSSTGLTDGTKCSVCQTVLSEQKEIAIAPANHIEKTVKGVAPTCTKTGLTDGVECSACLKTLTKQQIIPIDEDAHVKEVSKGYAPTCTQIGYTDGVKCSECGYVIQAQREIEETGHAELLVNGTAPTCSSTGLTDGVICSTCKEILTPQEVIPIDPVAHKTEKLPAVAVTCLTDGMTEGCRCTLCKITLVQQTVISAKGYHTEVTLEKKDATCTESGLTQGKACADCEEILEAQRVIPAEGHYYSGTTCIKCGDILVVSQGLEFTLDKATSTYVLSGLGSCTDLNVVVPSEYNGLPVTIISHFDITGSILSLNIPSSVTSINADVFKSCNIVNFLGSLEEWCNISFTSSNISNHYTLKMNGVMVEEIVIPDSITKLSANTFRGCSSIVSVDLNKVEQVGDFAFYACKNLSTIKIGSSLKKIEGTPFFLTSSSSNVIFKDESAFANWFSVELRFADGASPIGNSSRVYIGDTKISSGSITIPASVNIIYPNVLKREYGSIFNNVSFELTEKWFLTNDKNAVAGTEIDVTDPSKNSELLSSTYAGYFWKRVCPDQHVNIVTYNDFASTCTVQGVTGSKKCSACGTIVDKGELLPLAEHTEEVVLGFSSTCAKAGLSDGTKCSVCGDTVKEREPLPLLPHTEYVSKAGYASTCTTAGLSDEISCSVCNNIVATQKALSPAFHVLDNGVCTSCSASLIFSPASFSEGYAVSLPESLANIEHLVIPSSYNGQAVSEIDTIRSETLTTVFIPGSVKRIYSYAFDGCSKLENVTISEGVVHIGGGAFKDTAIKNIYIPASVEAIDGAPFENYSTPYVHIFCGADSQPEGWHQFWYMNYHNSNTVSWGVTYEEYLSEIS